MEKRKKVKEKKENHLLPAPKAKWSRFCTSDELMLCMAVVSSPSYLSGQNVSGS